MNIKLLRRTLTVSWFLAVCLLWRFLHWGLLNYHEQLQLFLFTSKFFHDTAFNVGGFADYVSQFLTQFFVIQWLGAAIVALLVVSVQMLARSVINMITNTNSSFVISFIPSIAAYCVLDYYETMPTTLVALVMGLVGLRLLLNISNLRILAVCAIVVGLIEYCLAGTAAMFVVLFGCIAVCYSLNKIKLLQAILSVAIGLIVWLSAVGVSRLLGTHSINLFLKGIYYMRISTEFPTMLYVSVLAIIATFVLVRFIPIDDKKERTISVVALIAVLVGGTVSVIASYDKDREQLLEYDCLCRQKKWSQMVALADKRLPVWVIGQNYLNLALAQTNQLSTRAFSFDPQGSPSLYVPFMRHHTMSISSGEVFYYLGLTHLARHHYCESQDAIPNGYLSSRYTMRIAEIDMINGDWNSAAKYLRHLQHTLFYSKWATSRLAFCNQQTDFDSNSEYGRIKNYKLKNNFVSDENYNTTIVELVLQNPQNRMAWDYLLIHLLFDKNLSEFIPAFVNYAKQYPQLPQVYQEALLLAWSMSHPNFNSMPYTVSQANLNRFGFFMNTYQKNQHTAAQVLEKGYANTVWYYMFTDSRN